MKGVVDTPTASRLGLCCTYTSPLLPYLTEPMQFYNEAIRGPEQKPSIRTISLLVEEVVQLAIWAAGTSVRTRTIGSRVSEK